jgi:hypothetical protein
MVATVRRRPRGAASPARTTRFEKDDFVMNFKRNALLALIGLVVAGSAATGASAAPLHPRREQVNERLAHQNLRIQEARRDGAIGPHRAWRLHRADYRVRLQERRFAFHHHGHISRMEQHRLNREENRINHHI